MSAQTERAADPSRATWLDLRRNGLGGSDIACLFTPEPFRPSWLGTALSVYLDKVDPPPDRDSPAMHRGRWLESAVANWYAHDAGVVVKDSAHAWCAIHTDPTLHQGAEPWMLASADRAVAAPREPWFGLECKTSRSTTGYTDDIDGAPVHVVLQATWYMTVLKAHRWDIAVYFPIADRFARYRLDRDDAVCKALADKARAFWFDHVVALRPPPVTHQDNQTVGRLYRNPKDEGIEPAGLEEALMLCDYVEARDTFTEAKQRKEELETSLKAAIGDNIGIRSAAATVTWRPTATGSRRLNFKRGPK